MRYLLLLLIVATIKSTVLGAENVLFYTSFQASEGWNSGGAASSSSEFGGEKIVSITDVVYSNRTLELKLYRVGVDTENIGKCTSLEGQKGRAQVQKDNRPFASSDYTFQNEAYSGYIMFPPFEKDVVVSWTCDPSSNLDRSGYVATADWIITEESTIAPSGLNNDLWTTDPLNLAPAVNNENCVSFTTAVVIPAGKFFQIRSHSSGGGIYFRNLKIVEYIPDVTPPAFQSSIPQNGAVDISVEDMRSVQFEFSEPINLTFTGGAVLYKINTEDGVEDFIEPILEFTTEAFSISGSILTINFPNEFSLENGTFYQLYVEKEVVKDMSGNSMDNELSISFSTIKKYDERLIILQMLDGNKTTVKINDVAKINFENTSSSYGNVVITLKDESIIVHSIDEVKRMYLFEPSTYKYTKIYLDAIPSGKRNRSFEQCEARVLDSIKGFKPEETLPIFKKFGRDETRQVSSTGFFRTEKMDGRWWIIDPDGYPVYMRGICELNKPGGTSPNSTFPLGNPKYQAFNSLYGNTSTWIRAAIDSLNYLGFGHSGLGGVTSEIVKFNSEMAVQGRAMSYTIKFDFMTDYLKSLTPPLAKKSESRTFDPDFIIFCDNLAKATITSALANDRNLYGYYSDNELMFGMESLERYLNISDANDPSRLAVEGWLVDNGYTKSGINDLIRAEFAGYEARYYYQIVTTAIRKYDKNHLFLGSRLHSPSRLIPEIIRVENEFSDVCSINYYNEFTPLASTFKIWAENLPDKPFHVTEFYSKAYNSGIWGEENIPPFFNNGSGVGVITKNQRDRAVFYENFTLGLLENKQCVGFDLYKYSDDDSTDNTGNDISNKGLFSNVLEGWQPYAKSAQKINRNVYQIIEFFDKQP